MEVIREETGSRTNKKKWKEEAKKGLSHRISSRITGRSYGHIDRSIYNIVISWKSRSVSIVLFIRRIILVFIRLTIVISILTRGGGAPQG